jgi:hypothetical protein
MQIVFFLLLLYFLEEAIELVRRVSDVRSHGNQQFIESIRITWRTRCWLSCPSLHSSDRIPLSRTIARLLRWHSNCMSGNNSFTFFKSLISYFELLRVYWFKNEFQNHPSVYSSLAHFFSRISSAWAITKALVRVWERERCARCWARLHRTSLWFRRRLHV